MASYANRPSLIQDDMVNTDLPDHLSNIWSNHPSHRYNAVTASGEETEGRDTADDQVTILYLNAMIEHSKIYSKVWRELHFEDLSDQPINQATLESLESMLSMWKHNLPNGLKFNASFAEEELHRPMRARRSRLRILLHMVSSLLAEIGGDASQSTALTRAARSLVADHHSKTTSTAQILA